MWFPFLGLTSDRKLQKLSKMKYFLFTQCFSQEVFVV
jgi:hypothetical protein